MAIKNKQTENPETSPFLTEGPQVEAETAEASAPVAEAPVAEVEAREVKPKKPRIKKMEKEIPLKKQKTYWEFGLLLVVGLVLLAVVGLLVFLAVKKSGNPDAAKVSIQDMAGGAAEPKAEESSKKDGSAETSVAQKENATTQSTSPLETAVKILNGGAAGGSAGKAKEVLVAKGYKKIEAGNSSKSDYVGVTVFYQASAKTVADKVVADLKAKYPTATAKPAVSAEEKSGPIVVILGK